MFAATTCSRVVSPATFREKRLWRGRIARIVERASPARVRRATQSPTAGYSTAVDGLVAEAAGHARQRLALRGQDPVDVLVFERDAARHDVRRRVRLEGLREAVVPAERLKREHAGPSAHSGLP